MKYTAFPSGKTCPPILDCPLGSAHYSNGLGGNLTCLLSKE